MPTIITHAAVPICLGLGLGKKIIPPRLLLGGIILAMLPDADVLAFKFGVAYGNALVTAGSRTLCCLHLWYRYCVYLAIVGSAQVLFASGYS